MVLLSRVDREYIVEDRASQGWFDRRGVRKILLSLLVVGAITAVVGGGSFASFSAQTTNPANTFAAGTLTMTNVTPNVNGGANCAAETYSSTCATLFKAGGAPATSGTTGLTNFKPGGPDTSNTVAITDKGTFQTGDFRLYGANYATKGAGANATLCTATDPAAKVNMQVAVGSTVIYPVAGTGYGTLKEFAATDAGAGTGLVLKGGANGAGAAGKWDTNDAGTYTIRVNLDTTADNTYQGCQSSLDFVWYAAQ